MRPSSWQSSLEQGAGSGPKMAQIPEGVRTKREPAMVWLFFRKQSNPLFPSKAGGTFRLVPGWALGMQTLWGG